MSCEDTIPGCPRWSSHHSSVAASSLFGGSPQPKWNARLEPGRAREGTTDRAANHCRTPGGTSSMTTLHSPTRDVLRTPYQKSIAAYWNAEKDPVNLRLGDVDGLYHHHYGI